MLFGEIKDPAGDDLLKGIFKAYYLEVIGNTITNNSFAYLSIGSKFVPDIREVITYLN